MLDDQLMYAVCDIIALVVISWSRANLFVEKLARRFVVASEFDEIYFKHATLAEHLRTDGLIEHRTV